MAIKYNKDTDYQALIDKAAESGNYKLAGVYEQQRNAKIDGEGSPYEKTYKYKDYYTDPSGGFDQAIMSNTDWQKTQDYQAQHAAALAAGNQAGADAAHNAVEGIRAEYGYSGGKDGSQYIPINTYDRNYLTGQMTQMLSQSGKYDAYQNGWGEEMYQQLLEKAFGMNYEDWTQSDAYQALADRYSRNGQRAMQNTMGQLAANTGGLASSYAGAMAQQQYNSYMEALEDAARAAYKEEYNTTVQNAGLARDYGDMTYSRWLDGVNLDRQARQEREGMLNSLLGYTYLDDETSYDRDQTSRNEAQDRIYDFLSIGGKVSDLDPQLIATSGLTTPELNQAAAEYLANQTRGTGGSGGSRRSSGSRRSTRSNSEWADAGDGGYVPSEPIELKTIGQVNEELDAYYAKMDQVMSREEWNRRRSTYERTGQGGEEVKNYATYADYFEAYRNHAAGY